MNRVLLRGPLAGLVGALVTVAVYDQLAARAD